MRQVDCTGEVVGGAGFQANEEGKAGNSLREGRGRSGRMTSKHDCYLRHDGADMDARQVSPPAAVRPACVAGWRRRQLHLERASLAISSQEQYPHRRTRCTPFGRDCRHGFRSWRPTRPYGHRSPGCAETTTDASLHRIAFREDGKGRIRRDFSSPVTLLFCIVSFTARFD